jgi:pyruvate dehydrogenase E2 component (dihydrolipoamide acetyltransferase)
MSGLEVFRLPDLGEGLTEAEVVDWRVAVGETVEVDQVIAEVETAKAAVEVPCPHAGTVAELHVAAGSTLAVGAPLITVRTAGAEPDGHAAHRQEERAGSGNVLIGYGTAPGRTRRARASLPAAAGRTAPPRPAVVAGRAPPRVLSPLVRKRAREHGVDLDAITPSGLDRVITRADVEAAIEGASGSGFGEVRIPLRGVRGVVAERLSRSRREIPDATTWVDVDATALLAARDALRVTHPAIGLLALLARICVAGLARFPELNSTIDTRRDEIVQLPRVHLGLAAQTDRGLLVPVVRDAGSLPTARLAEAIAGVTAQARAGSLTAAQLTGGTFTLNNYGVFGVDGSAPIINHPEAAILGVGRVTDRPWVVNGELAVRKVTQLSLAFDHRVCDGGTAGGFLRYVADGVECPLGLLADL